ncbi:SAM-dependent methyltransferase [Capnocytophaga leadbetteri]|jgi:Cyclopropane fatty acid synthase and related methyltransferases|uniref:SAM-dependent methyltransferase n=1 Tax=Capnocytophaga leadbetteri TaxID=327575 RepID=A0A250FBR3_9FLAO|nr:methyltransferase domain-containing protein [Capnocytophaga leadbetteri]ATA81478.1 SAM-dependent methyltransferase [Capnocytophaga leadbetteri]
MKDLFGQAILDYQQGAYTEDIKTETTLSEEDVLPLPYLFRSFAEMPPLEQQALQLARGRVLEVGCGAGSHGLYLQNERGLEVCSIDLSAKAIEACRLRGLHNAQVQNVLDLKGQYDTILLLMNGAGMCGRLKKMGAFYAHLKTLLAPNGQILTDSSDIIYMFDQNPDGSYDVPLLFDYYGEVDYVVKYKGEQEPPFEWLYVDYNTLQNVAHAVGLQCELVAEGEHFDYLAKLTN